MMMEKKKGPGRPKGLPKTGGRKKGTVNITNQNFYDVLTLKIAERLPKIFEWLDQIDDPYQKITSLLKIMEFRYPKQKAVEFKLDEKTSNTLEEKLYNLLQDPEK